MPFEYPHLPDLSILADSLASHRLRASRYDRDAAAGMRYELVAYIRYMYSRVGEYGNAVEAIRLTSQALEEIDLLLDTKHTDTE